MVAKFHLKIFKIFAKFAKLICQITNTKIVAINPSAIIASWIQPCMFGRTNAQIVCAHFNSVQDLIDKINFWHFDEEEEDDDDDGRVKLYWTK